MIYTIRQTLSTGKTLKIVTTVQPSVSELCSRGALHVPCVSRCAEVSLVRLPGSVPRVTGTGGPRCATGTAFLL